MNRYDGDHDDRLDALLSRGDAEFESDRPFAPAKIVAGALGRVRARRKQRWLAYATTAVACAVGAGVIVPRLAFHDNVPRASGDPSAARWRSELATLHAETDRISARLAELRAARASLGRATELDLLRATLTEQRNRAAYALVRSGERFAATGADAEVAAAYHRAADAFPDTPWGTEARKRLEIPR